MVLNCRASIKTGSSIKDTGPNQGGLESGVGLAGVGGVVGKNGDNFTWTTIKIVEI